MDSLPFSRPGRFYRGNLHTHSTRSDGTLSPPDVVAAYRDHGYDFVVLTDHFLEEFGFPVTDTRALRTPKFTTLLGAELHGPQTAVGEAWHLLAIGLPFDFQPDGAGETGPELAARAAAAGAFIVLAHPAWYGLTLTDALSVGSAHAVEIYNETCAHLNDRASSLHLSDMLLEQGWRVSLCAADDAHFDSRPDRFAAWVHVKAERLEPDLLLNALKAGHYYSSQGPQIHALDIDADTLRIACSPARAVFLTGPGSRALARHGTEITGCEFPLEPFRSGYCRLTVIDATDKRAWSNPIWLN